MTIIDVSEWQGVIDWNKAKPHIDGVILRRGDAARATMTVNGCGIQQSVDFGHAAGAQDVYNTGDWVHYPIAEDKIWISTSDNNVWQPGVYGWEIYTN